MKLQYILFFSFFTVLFLSCNDEASGTNENDARLADLRLNIANFILNDRISNTYSEFNNDTDALVQAADAFVDSTTIENLTVLRVALMQAWDKWQPASIYQFGPAQEVALNKIVNTFPSNVNKIEQNILEGQFELNNIDNFEAGGLPAIDYLINGFDDDKIISDFNSAVNRGAYLTTITDLIFFSQATVSSNFNSAEFAANFLDRGNSGTDVGSPLGQLINAIDFHIQRLVRDAKVAIPAGIRSVGVVRPTNVEALYSGQSRDLLLTSLVAYRALFKGKQDTGLQTGSIYEYLEALGENDLPVSMDAAFNQAIDLVQDLDRDLANQIQVDNDKMISVFIQIQQVITLIKTDLVSTLGVTITNQDNDGD